ncbi:hypothetical protein EVAR_67641_1 [Eumeta japonica]|uniref:Uncharacterized protein n=1 Tax=Eumeta variegata TaxID=151549 RepID=A0A4C1Z9P7_EUMVA|nr:hypothetical protein EVAR_67641_1 [Eumeta japonica]
MRFGMIMVKKYAHTQTHVSSGLRVRGRRAAEQLVASAATDLRPLFTAYDSLSAIRWLSAPLLTREVQNNTRNPTAVNLVMKASQWRKIGTQRRRRNGRGTLSLRTASLSGIPSRRVTALAPCLEEHVQTSDVVNAAVVSRLRTGMISF